MSRYITFAQFWKGALPCSKVCESILHWLLYRSHCESSIVGCKCFFLLQDGMVKNWWWWCWMTRKASKMIWILRGGGKTWRELPCFTRTHLQSAGPHLTRLLNGECFCVFGLFGLYYPHTSILCVTTDSHQKLILWPLKWRHKFDSLGFCGFFYQQICKNYDNTLLNF